MTAALPLLTRYANLQQQAMVYTLAPSILVKEKELASNTSRMLSLQWYDDESCG